MAEDSLFSDESSDEDQLFSSTRSEIDASQYRSLSPWAVATLVLALLALSLLILMGPDGVFLYAPVQLAGIVVGLIAMLKIRRNSFEFAGEKVTRIGLTINTVFLLIMTTWATIVYFTEVPEGYSRISFSTLEAEGVSAGSPISPAVAQYDGEPVFVKGYIHPGVNGLGNITRFVLVGDLKTCCFGGQPKPWDMIEVDLLEGQQVTYNMKKHGIWGRMRIDLTPRLAVGSSKEATGEAQLQGGYFRLEADGVK